MKKLILLFSILSFNTLQAQDKETRKLSSFDGIEVGEAIELILEKGSNEQAIVEVDGIDIDRVVTDVIGSTLKVRMKRGNYRSTSVTVYVTYKRLESLDVNSAASVSSKSVIESERLFVDVNSAGSAKLKVNVDKMKVAVNSAGKLVLSGQCNIQELDIDSAGKLNAFDLKSKRVDGNVDSAGKAEVYAVNEINVHADSGGSLYYKGNPDRVIVDSDSGGRVRKAN